MNTHDCNICSQLKPLDVHLFDLATYCSYLNNVIFIEKDSSKQAIKTKTIGDWLRLSAQLEHVEINTWKFAGESELYCGSAADTCDSDMEHFSSYSTALTKFIFVSNALEELYKFIAPNYTNNPSIKTKGLSKPSIKTAELVSLCQDDELPVFFKHKMTSLVASFKKCKYINGKKLTGLNAATESDINYGLHVIRNIRNFIAHCDFPIIENPNDTFDYDDKKYLISVLMNSCRMSALYIQLLIGKYNIGMMSSEYKQLMQLRGEEFEKIKYQCTPQAYLDLHIKGRFDLQF